MICKFIHLNNIYRLDCQNNISHPSLLHAGHLIPLPGGVIHLPGQEAGQEDPGQLEDDHHSQRGGNGRNTSLQEERVAALGHLWEQLYGRVRAGQAGHVQAGAEAAGGRNLDGK